VIFDTKEKGFTIVELMVVFIIFGIILAISFVGFKDNQQKVILDSTAFKLVANIRKQQSIAGLYDASCVDSENYKYGHGIYFTTIKKGKGVYILFSDCDGDNYITKPSPWDTAESIPFPSGVVQIESISVDGNLISELNIVFNPPGPSVIINGLLENSTAIIKINLISDTLKTKTITVNKVGMIDID